MIGLPNLSVFLGDFYKVCMFINNVRINIVNSTVIIKNISEFIYFVRVNFVKYRYGMVYTLYSTVCMYCTVYTLSLTM